MVVDPDSEVSSESDSELEDVRLMLSESVSLMYSTLLNVFVIAVGITQSCGQQIF
jgi:hypothetical protein